MNHVLGTDRLIRPAGGANGQQPQYGDRVWIDKGDRYELAYVVVSSDTPGPHAFVRMEPPANAKPPRPAGEG